MDKNKMTPEELAKFNQEFAPAFAPIAKFFSDFQERMQLLYSAMAKKLKAWEENNHSEFEETLATVKGYLFARGLILPRNWKEVYLDWLCDQVVPDNELADFSRKQGFDLDGLKGKSITYGEIIEWDNIPLDNRQYIIDWAKVYTKEKDKPKPKTTDKKKPLRTDLRALFEEANKLDAWKKIITELKRNEQIDPDSNKWLGNMDELAGTIRVIEFNHLKLKRKLSIKEIIKIAMINFSFSLNDENVKGETVRKWNDRIRM